MRDQLGDLPWSRPHTDMAADAGGKIPSWFARFPIHTPLFSGDHTDEYLRSRHRTEECNNSSVRVRMYSPDYPWWASHDVANFHRFRNYAWFVV